MTKSLNMYTLTISSTQVLTSADTRGDISTSEPLRSQLADGLGTPVYGMAMWNSCPAFTVMSFTLDRSSFGFSVVAKKAPSELLCNVHIKSMHHIFCFCFLFCTRSRDDFQNHGPPKSIYSKNKISADQ